MTMPRLVLLTHSDKPQCMVFDGTPIYWQEFFDRSDDSKAPEQDIQGIAEKLQSILNEPVFCIDAPLPDQSNMNAWRAIATSLQPSIQDAPMISGGIVASLMKSPFDDFSLHGHKIEIKQTQTAPNTWLYEVHANGKQLSDDPLTSVPTGSDIDNLMIKHKLITEDDTDPVYFSYALNEQKDYSNPYDSNFVSIKSARRAAHEYLTSHENIEVESMQLFEIDDDDEQSNIESIERNHLTPQSKQGILLKCTCPSAAQGYIAAALNAEHITNIHLKRLTTLESQVPEGTLYTPQFAVEMQISPCEAVDLMHQLLINESENVLYKLGSSAAIKLDQLLLDNCLDNSSNEFDYQEKRTQTHLLRLWKGIGYEETRAALGLEPKAAPWNSDGPNVVRWQELAALHEINVGNQTQRERAANF